MTKTVLLASVVLAVFVAVVARAGVIDPVISSNDPLPFPRDSENEPSLAIDRSQLNGPTTLLVAGGNDYRDQPPCQSSVVSTGASTGCSFRPGIGISGIYTSVDAKTWTSGSYGTALRTLPKFSKYLWSFGDASVASGPSRVGTKFSWATGRFYYASLAARARDPKRVITVSFADHAPNAPLKWTSPRIVSRGLFSDRPTIWADDAGGDSNPRFGFVYLCWTVFKAKEETEATERAGGAIAFSLSKDGGSTWPLVKVFQPTAGFGAHGCVIRTDSDGGVEIFWQERRVIPNGTPDPLSLAASGTPCASLFDARIVSRYWAPGATWFGSPEVVAKTHEPGRFDRAQERCTGDGTAGARVNGWPTADIANGAPIGHGKNLVAVAWADGDTILAATRVAGTSGQWSAPVDLLAGTPQPGHPALPSIALSPDGNYIYLVYLSFLQDWQRTVSTQRLVQAIVRTTPVTRMGRAHWGEIRGPTGDARGAGGFGPRHGSQAGVAAEFLGDELSVVADASGGYAAWTDVSGAVACSAVNGLRSRFIAKGSIPTFKSLDCGEEGGRRFGNTTLCSVTIPPGFPQSLQLAQFCLPPP